MAAVEEWQRWQRPGPTAAQQRNDVWLGAAVMAGAVVATVLITSMGGSPFGRSPALSEQLLWMVALTAPLVLRRRFPTTVVLLVAVVFIGSQARAAGDGFLPSIALFMAIYTLGAWGRDRTIARWVRIGVMVAMFSWLGVAMTEALGTPPEFTDAAGPLDPLLSAVLYTVGVNLVYFLVAYLFGNVAWESARRQHRLAQQGEQLRRSQAENARQAVVTERLRIARDLHDVVAHHVSVMGVQAAAARRVLRADPEQASTCLSAVETTARTAIGELRGLVGVLRAEPGADEEADGHRSAPGLDQLPALAEETRATGLAVTHAVFGEPRPVPDAVAVSAYRVAQEALTNTVKHAAARTADVRVRYLDSALEVEVSDDGRGSAVPAPRDGSGGGLGLVGMRERIAVHGGELEVGPRQEGGFRVRARFPLAPAGTPAAA